MYKIRDKASAIWGHWVFKQEVVLHSFAQIYHIIQLLLKNVSRCTFSGKQNQRLDLVKIINEHILSALLQHNNHFRISNIWVLKDLVRYESKSSVILSWHCLDVLKFIQDNSPIWATALSAWEHKKKCDSEKQSLKMYLKLKAAIKWWSNADISCLKCKTHSFRLMIVANQDWIF